jgi:hypothetical protein
MKKALNVFCWQAGAAEARAKRAAKVSHIKMKTEAGGASV